MTLETAERTCEASASTVGQTTKDTKARKSHGSCRLNWTASSPTMLCSVEKRILSFLKTPYRECYVDIGATIGKADKIWTISLNSDSKEVPLVMLHGLGAGVALWVMNFDALAKDRPVYAMDVLGFGRSSRPTFSKDALICEKQLVKSVEEWRREMNINNMILLGHSMGGYIASSYALSYPDRVKHLILADPWGFPHIKTDSIPLWVRAIAYPLTPLNPLWAIRAAGPFGQWAVKKARADITRKFAAAAEDSNLLPQYIHQCNAQAPSGESAFHTMMKSFGWAKNPMIDRIKDVRHDIPITFIYGSRSWLDSSSGEMIKSQRSESYVDIKFVTGAGHHVYADIPDVFNRYVNEICDVYKVRNLSAPLIRKTTESDEEQEIAILLQQQAQSRVAAQQETAQQQVTQQLPTQQRAQQNQEQ